MPAFTNQRSGFISPASFFPQSPGGASIPIPFTGLEITPDLPFIDIGRRGPGGTGMVPFRPTMAGAVAQRFMATNPATGRLTWFGPLGQPVLWTGDIRAAKRVNRVARRALRARGRR